ncbi:MAG TPA: DUF4139 domain-containing protein [Allosphingosinicella sp.]|jgi:hypothetical protein|nr:DUF4139 domain-containing protein [Allosphingosinicella sp.]
MRRLLLLSACLAMPAAAQGPAISPAAPSAQGDVAVTIYNDNLALVQDTRQLDIPAGRTRLEFPDVSAQIRAETVSFAAPDTGIVEQNFDYDLLSPGKLMEKAVGKIVTIVRVNPATGAETREQARILATNGGVVLQIGSRIEVLRDDGLPVRVIFDQVPPNLRARPTLSVTVESSRAGRRPARLTYLTPGLGWKADYVALFDEAAGRIDVQGWITLSNNSGTSYDNAQVLMVAGGPNQENNGNGNEGPYRRPPPPPRSVGTESGKRERLGDYYLYPLRERTTIAAAQTKQVSFLDVRGAQASKGYEYRVDWLQNQDNPASASTVIKFTNSQSGGVGDQLPAGTMRVYIKDSRAAPQFIGESAIGHTPMGSELAIRTGDAFDVQVKANVEKRETITSEEWERTSRYRVIDSRGGTYTVESQTNPVYSRTTMSYTLTNARPNPVTVDLVQAGIDRSAWHDTRVVSETIPGVQRSSDERLYHVTVPANGKTVVTAVFDTRY